MNQRTLPRQVETALAARLKAMPAVIVTGARQTGKSTLVKGLTGNARRYFTLDDLDTSAPAARDPEALLDGAAPITLDEVQRVPDLLVAVKRAKRLIKAPTLYCGDTGVALHLSGLAQPTGAHLENLVLQDLLAWRDARIARAEVCYWRTVPRRLAVAHGYKGGVDCARCVGSTLVDGLVTRSRCYARGAGRWGADAATRPAISTRS